MGQSFYNQAMHDYNINRRKAEEEHFVNKLGYEDIHQVDTRDASIFLTEYQRKNPEPQGLCECGIPNLLDQQLTKLKSYKFPSQGKEKEALIQDLKEFKTTAYFLIRLNTLIQLLESNQIIYTW